MLDTATKKRIDDCRDILVGKLPDPKAQIEQITIGLIYKFMDDMDQEAIELGGTAKFFSGDFKKYSWDSLFDTKVTAFEMLGLYSEAIVSMDKNPKIPQLFRDIFKNAFLPYRDPETLKLFLKTISEFEYTHSEKLGDAFEYLLSVMGSQGDAGQFRTPRHIIDFIVAVVDPVKTDTILDPACGTAGFLISAFKHIKEKNKLELNPDERKRLIKNFVGYDISPDMVRLSLVNLYLHGFSDPHIWEYDTLSSEERWNENFDVILANPPFMSPKGGIRPHKKFTISSNRSEVLFVDYIAEHLNPKGKAGIIVPEGVIFQSGTAYKNLRKMLVDNYLYAVVSLPAGIFNPYSGVKTSILLIDKELAKTNNEILFVKIDNDGYGLGAQRNAVKGGQLDDAIEIVKLFKGGVFAKNEIAYVVAKSEITKNDDYNLSGVRYKEQIVINTTYELKRLEDISTVMAGGTPSRDEPRFWGGNIPWVGSSVCKNVIVTEAEEFISALGLKNSSAKIFKTGTSLIALVGATIGKTGFLSFDCATNQNVAGLYPLDLKVLNKKYLFYSLQKLYPQFLNLSEGKFRMANLSFVRSLKIPLPPLSVQEEIVSEIEGYQKVIDGAKMVVEYYNPKIDINPSWEILELGAVCKPEYGFTETAKDEGDARFIRITDIGTDGKLKNKDAKYVELTKDAKKSLVKKDDILVARTGATYGKTMIYDEEYPAVFASFLIRLNFDLSKIYPKYYWVFAQSENYIQQAAGLMTGGGQPQFNGNAIVKIQIPIPSIEEQKDIVINIEEEMHFVSANRRLIEIFEKKIKNRIAKVWGE